MARTSFKRVQAVFSPKQYELLEEYVRQTGRSLSAVVRDSVAEHLLADLVKARKRRALAWNASGNDPVSDWPETEKELDATEYACNDGIPVR